MLRQPAGRQTGVRRFSRQVVVRMTAGDAGWVKGEADRLGIGEAELLRRLVSSARGMSEDRALGSAAE